MAISNIPFDLDTYNASYYGTFILGTSGSGKGMIAKALIKHIVKTTNDMVLIFDSTGEYTPFVKSLGGDAVIFKAGNEPKVNMEDHIINIDVSYHRLSPQFNVSSIIDFFEEQVNFNCTHGRRTHIFFDGIFDFLNKAESIDPFKSAWLQWHLKDCQPTLIERETSEILKNNDFSSLLPYVERIIFLQQSLSDIPVICDLWKWNLSNTLIRLLHSSTAGTGVVIQKNRVSPFFVNFQNQAE